jgi:hypothetical protein
MREEPRCLTCCAGFPFQWVVTKVKGRRTDGSVSFTLRTVPECATGRCTRELNVSRVGCPPETARTGGYGPCRE